MTTFWFGVHFAEAVSVNLLPLTLYLFTENAFYIGLILAINSMFGFIAQPVVGVLSDRTWTRVGRRAFYLIVAAPIVAATEIAMPFATALWLVVVLVIVMQFFVDVMAAAYHPMLAEMVPPHQRSMVAGINKCGLELAWILVLFVGMPWVTLYREQQGGGVFYGLPLYCLAAAVLLVFVMLAAVFLKEKRLDPLRPRAPLTPRQFAMNRLNRQMAMIASFVVMIVCCVVGYVTETPGMLLVAATCFGLADILIDIAHKTLCTDFYVQGMIGQQATTMNIFYGVGRTLGLVLVGATINYVFEGDYSVIWSISGVLSVVGILVLLRVRDVRYEDRLRERAPARA